MTSTRGTAAIQEMAPVGEAKAGTAQLTPMEQACLRLVAKHLSSKEIAAELGIAKTSVDTYCNRARTKLGVGDRYEAARRLVSDPASAAPRFGPPILGAAISTPTARDVAPVARMGGALSNRAPLLGVTVMFIATILALATLLSGLRALEVMRPPLPGPPHH